MYNAKGKENMEWINKLMDLTRMHEYEEYYVSDLSAGLKKRLDIVVSLLNNPDIIVMDEPTNELDITSRKEVLSLIQVLHENKKTILIATHDLTGFDGICTYLIVLKNGVKLTETTIPGVDTDGITKIYEKYITSSTS